MGRIPSAGEGKRMMKEILNLGLSPIQGSKRRPGIARFSTALFLIFALALTVRAETSAPPLSATGEPDLPGEFRLRLQHLHTGESIDVAYRRGDDYLPSGLDLLNHFLRDYRTGDDAHYDPKELDLLYAILQKLHRPNAVIDVLCGYRTPETNSYLRTRSPSTGVAENSEHMASKAIDIRIPGVSTVRLRDAALSLGMGGVGYYPVSHFVHVDVGPVRQWTFGGQRVLRASRGHARHHQRSHAV